MLSFAVEVEALSAKTLADPTEHSNKTLNMRENNFFIPIKPLFDLVLFWGFTEPIS